MTIYRKVGSDLDDAVRVQVTGVMLAFVDARLSEEEMFALVRRIIGDTGYWQTRGVCSERRRAVAGRVGDDCDDGEPERPHRCHHPAVCLP